MLSQALKIERVVVDSVDITEQIVAETLQRASIVLLGMLLGGLALSKYWRVFAVVSAGLYLWVWFFSGSTHSLPLIEAFALKWRTANVFGTYASFLLRDVALPLLFLTVIGLCIASRRTPPKQPSPN